MPESQVTILVLINLISTQASDVKTFLLVPENPLSQDPLTVHENCSEADN